MPERLDAHNVSQAPTLAERIRGRMRLLLGTLIIASVALNFSNVIARYFFLSPFSWAEAIITYIMIWSSFLGAALITLDDKHLQIDLIAAVFPSRLQAALRALGAICLVAVALVVIPQSWEATEVLIRNDQRTAVEGLPLAIPNGALLAGFVLMAVAGVYQIVMKLRQAMRPVAVTEVQTGDKPHSKETGQ